MSRDAQVLEILAKVLNKERGAIQPAQDLKNDLEIDSAQTLELLSTLEDTFDVEIEETAAAKVQTVADLQALIAAC